MAQDDLDALLRELQDGNGAEDANVAACEQENGIGSYVTDAASNVVGFVFSPVRFQPRIGRYEDGPRATYNVPRYACERSGNFVVLVKIDRRSGRAVMVDVPDTNSLPDMSDSFFYYEWLYRIRGRHVMDMRDVPCISCFY